MYQKKSKANNIHSLFKTATFRFYELYELKHLKNLTATALMPV